MTRYAFQKDATHAAFVALWEAHGGTWFDTADHRKLGVDGFLCRRAGLYFEGRTVESCWVEIKNGALPPSRRALTPSEKKFRDKCHAAGVPWLLVETEEEALALVRNVVVK